MSDRASPPEPVSAPSGPPDLRLRADPPRVMRLSRRTLTILGVVASAGIGAALIYALQPPGRQEAQELFSTEGRAGAGGLADAPADYSQVPQLGPPLPGDLGRPILSAQARGEDVPVPMIGGAAAGPTASPQAGAAEAARQRAIQEGDAARMSQLFLGGASSAGATPTTPTLDIMSAALGGGAPAIIATPTPAGTGQDSQRAFLNAEVDRRTAASDRLTAPASPHVVQAGSIIPAALITGIRSDLPGQITAQVTQNVYDSATGRLLLIPQGSRLIGEYDSQVSFGQNRVLLAWDRLILPGGRSIVLERQPGADAAGFAGLQDRTDYHWRELAKAALISTLLGVGTELGADEDDDLTRALRRGTQDTINQTGQQIVRRQLNVQPTLTIRPGFPVWVIVTRDLVLGP